MPDISSELNKFPVVVKALLSKDVGHARFKKLVSSIVCDELEPVPNVLKEGAEAYATKYTTTSDAVTSPMSSPRP